jgi:hypothetical protein
MNDGRTVFAIRSLDDDLFRAASQLRRGSTLASAAEQLRDAISRRIDHESAERWIKWWVKR